MSGEIVVFAGLVLVCLVGLVTRTMLSMQDARLAATRQVPCPACEGTGRSAAVRGLTAEGVTGSEAVMDFLKASQGICLACGGKGTHTIVGKEEKAS